jgi:hypothetical protein
MKLENKDQNTAFIIKLFNIQKNEVVEDNVIATVGFIN